MSFDTALETLKAAILTFFNRSILLDLLLYKMLRTSDGNVLVVGVLGLLVGVYALEAVFSGTAASS